MTPERAALLASGASDPEVDAIRAMVASWGPPSAEMLDRFARLVHGIRRPPSRSAIKVSDFGSRLEAGHHPGVSERYPNVWTGWPLTWA